MTREKGAQYCPIQFFFAKICDAESRRKCSSTQTLCAYHIYIFIEMLYVGYDVCNETDMFLTVPGR